MRLFSLKIAATVVTFLYVCLTTSTNVAFAQETTNCGQPDFDRMTDQGLFLWQHCASGDWSIRGTNGGQSPEFTVTGELVLSEPLEALTPFNLDDDCLAQTTEELDDCKNDYLVDAIDPEKVKFRFRVFQVAQDGADFKLAPDSSACLIVKTNPKVPIIVGGDNVEFSSPLNIVSLKGGGTCIRLEPVIYLLQEDDV